MDPLSGAAGLAAAIVVSQPLLPPTGRVSVSRVEAMQPGAAGELSVTILDTPAPGIALDLRLDGDEVRLSGNRLGWESVVDPQAQQPRLRVPFTAPEQPGRYAVRGWLRYVTCDADERCLPRVVTMRWQLEIAEPEAAPQS